MKCRNCGAELQMGEQFCYRCGNAIEDKPQRHCGYCGAQLEEGASFCFKCGRATLAKRGRGSAPTADAAEKEHRILEAGGFGRGGYSLYIHVPIQRFLPWLR